MYIKGSDISRSQVGLDEQKRYVVELEFSSEGAKKFAEATEKLVGQNMGIYMDEELISNPTVNAKITGGKAEITGMSSKEEAQSLSDKINSGALPFPWRRPITVRLVPHLAVSFKCHGAGSRNCNDTDLSVYDMLVSSSGSDKLPDTGLSDCTAGSGYFCSSVYHYTAGR